MLKQTNS